MWGLVIANHLDQSLRLTKQKYSAAVRSNLLHSFFGSAQLCCAFYQPWQAPRFGAGKPISWAKPAHFDFYAINFTVWSHILSTIGDALKNVCTKTDSWGETLHTAFSFSTSVLIKLFMQILQLKIGESPIGWNCKRLNWIWQSFLAIWKKVCTL